MLGIKQQPEGAAALLRPVKYAQHLENTHGKTWVFNAILYSKSCKNYYSPARRGASGVQSAWNRKRRYLKAPKGT